MDLKLIKSVSSEKNIKLEDLAKLANIKRATFFNYLSGKTSIPADALKCLSEILDIPIARLYDESNNLESQKFNEPPVAYSTNRHVKEVPLIHRFAYDSYISYLTEKTHTHELPKYPVLIDQQLKDSYLCFEVSGESMIDGTYESRLEGDIVLARMINKSHWHSDLSMHKTNFIIAHREKGLLIKRIFSHDIEKETITIGSLNPQYENFILRLSDVLELFVEIKLVQRNSTY